jgi:hypothetical protein
MRGIEMETVKIKGRLVGIEIPPLGATRVTIEVYRDDVHLIKNLVVGADAGVEQVRPV